jgi:hypothetical protein
MASLLTNQIARTLPPWIAPIEADRNRPMPAADPTHQNPSAKPNPTSLTIHHAIPLPDHSIPDPHSAASNPPGFDSPAAGVAARQRHGAPLLAVRSGTSWACTLTTTTARWGTILAGAAMADPSQEEEAAAAESAGDGGPSPRRPPRHHPHSLRSALLR